MKGGAAFYNHWETEGKQRGTKSGELPYCEIQGFAVYESVFSITIQNFFYVFVLQRIMCEQAAAESCCFFVHISILENMKRGQ